MEELDNNFEEACDSIKSCNVTDTKTLLQLYGLYKQATVGDVNIPKPSFFSFTARQKWDAWDALRNMSQDEAKRQYIDLVDEIQPQQSSKSTPIMGVAVSCLQRTEAEIEEHDKTVFDYVKEGNSNKVSELLTASPCLVKESDEDGLTLLHWAADRGDVAMIEMLATKHADLDAVDHSGQTALHYACSCGHDECVKVLEGLGASTVIRDNDGNLAKDVCL